MHSRDLRVPDGHPFYGDLYKAVQKVCRKHKVVACHPSRGPIYYEFDIPTTGRRYDLLTQEGWDQMLWDALIRDQDK